MSEINTGLRGALSNSKLYEGLQSLFGSNKGRGFFIDRYVKPSPNSRVLDIGCGPASLFPYMPTGVEYVGFDPNAAYIATAEKLYAGRGTFLARSFTEDDAPEGNLFDIVIISAVLHHLNDDEATRLFSLAARSLKPSGRVISIDCAFVDRQNPIARKLIEMDRGQNVRSPEGYLDLARPFFQTTGGDLTNISRIPYTHWIMQCAGPITSSASLPVP